MAQSVIFFAALFAFASGHIHSQKISGLQRNELSPSTWACALFSSALVGACGIFPLFLNRWIRLDIGCKDSLAFKVVLSFSVGGLLGDVFLHLLPEAYGAHQSSWSNTRETVQERSLTGLWVVIGVFSFLAVEKLLLLTEELEKKPVAATSIPASEVGNQNGASVSSGTFSYSLPRSGNVNSNCNAELEGSILRNNTLVRIKLHPDTTPKRSLHSLLPETYSVHQSSFALWLMNWLKLSSFISSAWLQKDASGYLNLVANCMDNFTHGLAIAAGYVVSPAVGMLTTLAILCHEVPHEVGDFAILLNSGFSLREAAKAQVITASGGFVGVIVGLTAEQIACASTWLLPFTAGGFLYIALVSIVPDLLEVGMGSEKKSLWTVVEVGAVGLGVVVMALVTIVEKKSCGYVPAHLIGT